MYKKMLITLMSGALLFTIGCTKDEVSQEPEKPSGTSTVTSNEPEKRFDSPQEMIKEADPELWAELNSQDPEKDAAPGEKTIVRWTEGIYMMECFEHDYVVPRCCLDCYNCICYIDVIGINDGSEDDPKPKVVEGKRIVQLQNGELETYEGIFKLDEEGEYSIFEKG